MRLMVEVYDPNCDDWELFGSVLLKGDDSAEVVGSALVSLGLYVGRGTDYVEWPWGSAFAAVLYDGNDTPMIRLSDRARWNDYFAALRTG